MSRQSLLSGLLGGILGLAALAAVLLSVVLVERDRLRALLFGTPTPGGVPLVTTSVPAPLPTAEAAACGGPAQMTLALLGLDGRRSNYDQPTRTDAISLVHINFVDQTAAVFSIPRDLYVPLPDLENVGIYQDRINTAYEYGEIWVSPGYGPTQFKNTIALNFGIRVDRYLMINFESFVAAVDALGGIDIEVPQAIRDTYFPADEGFGTIVFEVEAGRQHMDGRTALRYARTRHQDGDFARVVRQQQVLLAIRDKLASPEVIPQLPALMNSLMKVVRTDLSPGELAALACLGPQIDREAIRLLAVDSTMTMPWRTPTGGSVDIPKREAIAPLVEEFLK